MFLSSFINFLLPSILIQYDAITCPSTNTNRLCGLSYIVSFTQSYLFTYSIALECRSIWHSSLQITFCHFPPRCVRYSFDHIYRLLRSILVNEGFFLMLYARSIFLFYNALNIVSNETSQLRQY